MAKKKFMVDVLSKSSIEKLKEDLLKYQSELQAKTWELCQTLAEQGVEIAKARIATYDAIFTGELLSSIRAENRGEDGDKAVFVMVADSRHAVFVEFGTGQIGEEAAYPYPFPEGIQWDYNSGKTIFEVAPGEYGWFYPRDGKWYFTQGMPSRPFMYETSLGLQEIVVKTAKEVFEK